MRPILLIGHDRSETFGQAPGVLGDAGVEVLEHRAGTSGSSLPAAGDVSGVVVFGGEMNVDQIDEHPYLATERALAREAVDRGVPLLGICLGAQMLARALGREVFAAPVKEIGFMPLRPTPEAEEDPLLSAFADGDMVFHWHEDTFELPPEASLLARGDEVKVQAFRVGERAWGLQFHFEVDAEELELWLEDAGPDLEDRWGKSAETIRREAERYLERQQELARHVFRRFADVVRRAD